MNIFAANILRDIENAIDQLDAQGQRVYAADLQSQLNASTLIRDWLEIRTTALSLLA